MKLAVFVITLIVGCGLGLAKVWAATPNVVVLLADDLGYADLSCYGSEHVRSKNIDSLAAEGVRFTQFYANAPECTPTRTAFLTGRYQQRVGGLECAIGTGNHGRYDDAIRLCDVQQLGLPVDHAELPGALINAGYDTAIFGKWHLGYEPHFSPIEHGWGEFLGPLGGGVDYFHHTEPLGNFLGDDLPGEEMLYRGKEKIDMEGYLTDIITDQAVQWIESRDSEQPFFLYVPYTAPHTPIQGPQDKRPEKMTAANWNKGTKQTYVEMIQAMDEGIGRILRALAEKDLDESTVVIFFSDNGPTKMGETGGLRGTKGNVYEGGIRVPCIVRHPNKLAAGSVVSEPVIGMDLTASILSLAKGSPTRPLDGIDVLKHVAENQAFPKRPLFWRKRRGEVTVKAMREGDWKLVIQQNGKRVETFLYDLKNDPSEQKDRKAAQSQRTQSMLAAMKAWEREVAPTR